MMTSREAVFMAFFMRGFMIGLVACVAIWGAHCFGEVAPPPPSVDAGFHVDATLDTSKPLPEPPEGSEEYACDAPEVDCSAWPDDTGDYGPQECWPPADVPWQPYGRPAPGSGHLQQ